MWRPPTTDPIRQLWITVIVAACRPDVSMDRNMLRRVPYKHGNLQRNPAAHYEVEGILTATSIVIKAAKPVGLRVDVPEFAIVGEDVTIYVTPDEPARRAVRVTNEAGRLIDAWILRPARGAMTTTIEDLVPGAYTIEVSGASPASPFAPVSSDVLIWHSPEALAP
jgi:hypothetical protein